jgi:uncharacterized protein YciI
MSPADQQEDGRSEDKYCLVFLNSIPAKTPSPEVVNLHAAHLAELDKAEKLVLAGPIPERSGGLIVLRTKTLVEARAIAEEGPMVRCGYQTYELGSWFMRNRQNNFRPNVRGATNK